MPASRQNLLQCELPLGKDGFRNEINTLFADVNPGLQELGTYLSAELWRKCLDHVIRAGIARSDQEAVRFLDQIANLEPRMIGVGDFKGNPIRMVRRLESMFGMENGEKTQRVAVEVSMRVAGSVTHLL